MSYQLVSSRPHPQWGGERKLFKFDNGYMASVIRHRWSYGGDEGLWELAVLDRAGEFDYTTPITSGVEGHLTDVDVEELLARIDALPDALMLALPNPESANE